VDVKKVVKTFGQLVLAAALAIAVLGTLGAGSTPSAAAPVTPADTIGRAPKTHNPHNKRIKPYKYEKQVRYTTNSTDMPAAAPCAVLSSDPKQWPSGVYSCYGPPAAAAKQTPAKNKPAAKKKRAARPAKAARPRATSRPSGGNRDTQQYPASCG
jgi:hypothetical protein